MANFGIGLGAFADGFARGYGIRRQMKRDKRDDRKAEREDQRAQAMDQAWQGARTEYDAQVSDDVLRQAGQADPNQPFDADKANQRAQNRVGSFSDFVYQQQLPKIIDTALAQGDLDTADRLRKWGEDGNERRRTELFGSALNDFYAGKASGDYTAFADKSMQLLNDGGYGTNATGYEFVKDDQGNTTGVTFNLKDGDRKYSHTFNSMDEVGQFLAGQADPRSRVQMFEQQTEAASKFKGEMAKEQGKAQIGLSRDVALEDVKHQNRLQIIAAESKKDGTTEQANVEYMTNLLSENGYSEEEIRAYLPAMLKIGEFRKARSPEEFAQQIVLELTKDPMMSRRPIEELRERAAKLVDLAMSVGGEARQRPPANPSQQPGLGAR